MAPPLLRRSPSRRLRWLSTKFQKPRAAGSFVAGGEKNALLLGAFRGGLAARAQRVGVLGGNGDSRGAAFFAHLALRSRRGLPLSLPTTTGAPAPMPGGVFWRRP